MMLALLVFDCDGVILESLDVKTKAFYRIGLDFSQEAADQLVMFHRLHGGVSRYEKFAWLYERFMGRAITDEEKKTLNERFVSIALDEITHCALVPGVQEVLDAWKGRVPMFVASGAPEDELRFVLERRGLASYFDDIRGYPPQKTPLLEAIVKRSGLPPEQCVMVGDSFTDMRAAESVGTLFYGRGDDFKDSPWPWHYDLTLLNDYLNSLG
ncbi:HAD family hydrolase [Desulfovibrio sp. OttesenSCG-928-F20]|nr:HAD family hydrolase [Desulfovibrio sp. OttesenSCG-928-M16]MDL2290654.1 HAD family hydrolase [Desulfovibrio sp. OttesenSCG-928-F20]